MWQALFSSLFAAGKQRVMRPAPPFVRKVASHVFAF